MRKKFRSHYHYKLVLHIFKMLIYQFIYKLFSKYIINVLIIFTKISKIFLFSISIYYFIKFLI